MASNSPTPSGNSAGPRKAPPKKTISPWVALGALIGLGVGIYLISWVFSWVVNTALTGFTNYSLTTFGFSATIVILLGAAIVFFLLGMGKRK